MASTPTHDQGQRGAAQQYGLRRSSFWTDTKRLFVHISLTGKISGAACSTQLYTSRATSAGLSSGMWVEGHYICFYHARGYSCGISASSAIDGRSAEEGLFRFNQRLTLLQRPSGRFRAARSLKILAMQQSACSRHSPCRIPAWSFSTASGSGRILRSCPGDTQIEWEQLSL